MSQKKVVVTTKHRGVFFGTLQSKTDNGESAILTAARMCVSWSRSIRGVTGLAACGPDGQCRISHAVPQIELFDVTAIMDCTDEAAVAWESAPWA